MNRYGLVLGFQQASSSAAMNSDQPKACRRTVLIKVARNSTDLADLRRRCVLLQSACIMAESSAIAETPKSDLERQRPNSCARAAACAAASAHSSRDRYSRDRDASTVLQSLLVSSISSGPR